MAGRSVPEAGELSGGKRNLTIGRWAGAGAGAGVGILPPVYCYPEPPLAKLPPSLVCPSFLQYWDPAKYLLAATP